MMSTLKAENPIEEVWHIREELGAKVGYDVDKLFERLRREEKKHGDRVVHHLKQRAAGNSGAVLREKPPKPE